MMTPHSPYEHLRELNNFSLQHTLGSHQFKHQEGWASGLLWHPDGNSFFTIHGHGRILQTSVKTGEPLREALAFDLWIDRMSISPKGERWLLLGRMGGAALYHLPTKTLTWLRNESEDLPLPNNLQSAFSPDGAYIVVSSLNEDPFLVSVADLSTRPLPEALCAPFAFSPNGALFAASLASRSGVTLYSTATWQPLYEARMPPGENSALCFSPDGEQVIVANQEAQLFLFDTRGALLRTISKDPVTNYSAPQQMVLSPDHEWLYLVSRFGALTAIPLNGGLPIELCRVSIDSQATCIAPLSPGGTLAFGQHGHTFQLFDLKAQRLLEPYRGHTEQIKGLSSSPTGESVALADNDGVVRIWSTQTGACEWILEQSSPDGKASDPLLAVAYHPAGHELYALQWWNTLKRWELSSGLESALLPSYYEVMRAQPSFQTFALASFVLGPDGDKALLAGPAYSSDYSSENATFRVLLYSLSEAKILWFHTDDISRFSTYSFSPDGNFLLQVITSREIHTAVGRVNLRAVSTQAHAGQGRVFSIKDGKLLHTFRGPKGEALHAAQLLTEGRVVAAMKGGIALWRLFIPSEATPDREILWNPSFTGMVPYYINTPNGATRPFDVSQDETLLAASDGKGGIGIWELLTGKRIERIALEKTGDSATCLTFCRGGHRLVVGTVKGVGLIFAPCGA